MTRRRCTLTQIVWDFFPLHTRWLASSVFLNIDDGTCTSDSGEAWQPETAGIIPAQVVGSLCFYPLTQLNSPENTPFYCIAHVRHFDKRVCVCVYMYNNYTQPDVERTPRCAGGQLYHMSSPRAALICPPLLMSTLQLASENCQTHSHATFSR